MGIVRQAARQLLPEPVREKVHRMYYGAARAVARYVVPQAARSRWASRLYYLLASDAFGREQQAALYGRAKYHENTQRGSRECTLLRRNIHRLEKGLLMRPRRDIFALGYIKETVQAYARRSRYNTSEGESGEFLWARDVLEVYFSVTGNHPIIEAAERKFESVEAGGDRHHQQGGGEKRIPYRRTLDESPVSYEDLLRLSSRRCSVRWFQPRKVPRELIDKAIIVAREAPSACNRQPFEIRIYDDPELVEDIVALPGGTKGYAHNIPAIVVFIGRLREYFNERDRHVIYIDASLAAMSFMLALEAVGLSSCPINWPDVSHRERAMEELLNLEVDERPVMLLAIGYPSDQGMVAYSQKKDLRQIRSYNKR